MSGPRVECNLYLARLVCDQARGDMSDSDVRRAGAGQGGATAKALMTVCNVQPSLTVLMSKY